MAIGKFRKGARPRTRWWQPWWLVRTGGRGWLLLCDTCTQRLCGTQHSCVCVCVYKLCERDWHAIEINRCGCVMATISNIRGGGYCEIDCTRFFSPLSFFPFFFSPFIHDYNEHYRVRRKFEWKERSRCSIPLRKVKRPLSQTMKALFDLYTVCPVPVCTLNYFFGHSRCAPLSSEFIGG